MYAELNAPDSLQCMECLKIKIGGDWVSVTTSRVTTASHTICSGCAPRLMAQLRNDREFRRWGFEKQVEVLRIQLGQTPMDANTLRDRLSYYRISEPEAIERIVRSLSPHLVERLCPYCSERIAGSAVLEFVGYPMHAACARKLEERIPLLANLFSGDPRHTSAYMDYAGIPHAVRPGIRRLLQVEKKPLNSPASSRSALPR